jgi:hypothetical protein
LEKKEVKGKAGFSFLKLRLSRSSSVNAKASLHHPSSAASTEQAVDVKQMLRANYRTRVMN